MTGAGTGQPSTPPLVELERPRSPLGDLVGGRARAGQVDPAPVLPRLGQAEAEDLVAEPTSSTTKRSTGSGRCW